MCLRKSSCTFFAVAALALAACGDGGDGSTTTTTTTDDTNPSGQLNDLLLTATQQERNASAAKAEADKALKDATEKAAMLSAVKVMGESSDAQANAEAILKAQKDVDQALADANAALTALEKAKTEADKLPADTPKLEELKTSITAAITEATKHRDAVKAIKDAKATETGSLAAQRQMVTGVNGDMSPDDLAAMVAVDVEKAMVFPIGLGSTYSKITGGIIPTVRTVYLLSSGGHVDLSASPKLEPLGQFTVRHLPGVRLKETDYAIYGYWLGIPEDSSAIVEINTFGVPKNNRNEAQAANITATDIDGDMGKATYSGKALGISVMTIDDGNGGQKAIKSGEFTADVMLRATFASSPKVEGEVYNFKGNAVGEDWSVELAEVTLITTNPAADSFALTHVTGAPDGRWHARADSGTDAKRPMAISGGFRTFFPDGRAVGGYTTAKDD